MGYIGKETLDGYYFSNESILGLLEDIRKFIVDGRDDLFQIKTENIDIQWDNQVEKYIASIYVRLV